MTPRTVEGARTVAVRGPVSVMRATAMVRAMVVMRATAMVRAIMMMVAVLSELALLAGQYFLLVMMMVLSLLGNERL